MESAGPLSIEVRTDDMTTLTEVATAQYRSPVEHAAWLVHAALVVERNKANAPDKPDKRKGPRPS